MGEGTAATPTQGFEDAALLVPRWRKEVENQGIQRTVDLEARRDEERSFP